MLGIIGGSGLGQALGALGGKPARVDTPFGPPSGPILLTELDGVQVALLARHGEGHVHNPSRVPSRANIFAFKTLGVTHVLASAAVGSLHEDVRPRELVIPDQVIDRTYRRPGTFFEDLAVHVEFAVPSVPPCGRRCSRFPPRSGFIPAAPTSAWRAPSSPPAPRATCTAPGART
jgi:5'-methylthioadenosine phosphorylase